MWNRNMKIWKKEVKSLGYCKKSAGISRNFRAAEVREAASLPIQSHGPGEGGSRPPFCGHTAALPQHLSVFLPASCLGLGSVCMSDLSSLCWVLLNQNPAPPCVPKWCPSTHFGTPRRALLLLSCPCPAPKVWAEPRLCPQRQTRQFSFSEEDN